MKPLLAMLSLLLIPITAPGADGGGSPPSEQAPAAKPSAEPALSPLARKYAVKREALLKKYAQKRRALVESAEWKSLDEGARRAKLDALDSEARAADAKLTARYEARLDQGRTAKDAEQASADQARRRQLDELQVQAAQDAARTRTPP